MIETNLTESFNGVVARHSSAAILAAAEHQQQTREEYPTTTVYFPEKNQQTFSSQTSRCSADSGMFSAMDIDSKKKFHFPTTGFTKTETDPGMEVDYAFPLSESVSDAAFESYANASACNYLIRLGLDNVGNEKNERAADVDRGSVGSRSRTPSICGDYLSRRGGCIFTHNAHLGRLNYA